jgi:hypothetical protein
MKIYSEELAASSSQLLKIEAAGVSGTLNSLTPQTVIMDSRDG